MEKLSFKMPDLYADHQVGPIEKKLAGLAGIASVQVSPAFGVVTVELDTRKTSPTALKEALDSLTLGETGQMPAAPAADRGDPAWYRVGLRTTKTNPQEITMSGEFRKY